MPKKHIRIKFFTSFMSLFIILGNLLGCTSTTPWIHYSTQSPRTVRAIIEDNNHTLWFATSSSGQLYYHDVSLGKWILQSLPDGLGRVQTLMAGSTGDIWIGTDTGLARYQPNGNEWKVYSANDGLIKEDIRAISQDHDNTLWVGVAAGGLYQSINDGESWEPVTDFIGDTIHPTIYDIYQDSANNLWVSSGNLLSQYNHETRSWIKYRGDNSEPDLLVMEITEAPDGFLWFATLGGVYRYNPVQNSWERFTTVDGLNDNEVWAAKIDQQGNIWFGTKTGASMFNPTKNKWMSFNKESGFTNFTVSSIFVDSKGQVWFGTLGDGVYRYNSEK